MNTITVAQAIETKELRDEVQACVQALPVRVSLDKVEIADLPAFLEKLGRLRPDVVLVEVTRFRGSVLQDTVQQIKGMLEGSMIIALHKVADPDAILGAMRAGANEFLYPPLAASLRKALGRQQELRTKQREGARRKGKVMAFASVKGGCGATTIACHTAVELGREGKQSGLLADLDLDAGTVRFLMKSNSPYSLLDALNNLHRLDVSYWKALVSSSRPGLEIIGAPHLLSSQGQPDPEHLRQVLQFLRAHYDWMILDLGRCLSPVAGGVLGEVDELYLVTTLEIPALYRTRHIIQKLVENNFDRNHIHPILNRMPQRVDLTPEEFDQMLGRPVYAMLPNDYSGLYESYLEGKLLPSNSHLGKQLVKLAGKLAAVSAEV